MFLPLFGSSRERKLVNYINSLSGLVGYYPLNETSGTTAFNRAAATIGTGDGVNSSATVNQQGKGGLGLAYAFNGVDSKIAVTSPAQMNSLTACSIGFIAKRISNGGSSLGRIFHKGPNAVGYIDVQTNVSGLQASQDFSVSDPFTLVDSLSTTDFTFVVINIKGTTVKPDIYYNGTIKTPLGSSANGSGTIASDSTDMAIGNRTTDTARGFDGILQHLFLMNRELTVAEISTSAVIGGFR